MGSSIFAPLLVFGLAWAFALAVASAARAHDAMSSESRALRLVILAALHDAHARSHPRCTHVHIALALSFDPEVARRLARIGPLGALRERFEAQLAGEFGITETVKVGVTDPGGAAIGRVVAMMQGDVARRSPAQYLTALLDILDASADPSPDVHAIFQDFGLTKASWASSEQGAPRDESPPSGLPYRARPADKADRVVRFWNDDRTTQEMVVTLLTDNFGRSPAEARYLMTRTHYLGAADFGDFTEEEALLLVEPALARAREGGFPLRITVEPSAAPPPKLGWLARLRP